MLCLLIVVKGFGSLCDNFITVGMVILAFKSYMLIVILGGIVVIVLAIG
jgi:hypothetical protein